MPIIEVNHLTKEYQLGHISSLKDTALNTLRRMAFQPTQKREQFKALDDVNFHINEGEVVGIIGHNGAGKSTLLKHLANISNPTKGEVIVKGSVAPLIEVGAGVNPELTGRENIFLNGAILGIPKKIIKSKLDEIIEFSELEQFIDTPVKRYSSGMTVKLGFSIATSMEADILIVDEVLAVGDLAFQRKCFDRMEDLIKRRGKTVLIVSHNIRQIQRLCSRTIMLSHGQIVADGQPDTVCNQFYKQSNNKIFNTTNKQTQHTEIKTSGEVELESIEILDINNQITSEIKSQDPLNIRLTLKFNSPLKKPEIVIGTHTTDFVYLTACSTAIYDERPDFTAGLHTVHCIIPSYPIAPGIYCIRLSIFDQNRRDIYSGETLKHFTVSPKSNEMKEAGLRTLDLPSNWVINNKIIK
ncbi:ABC transporter ATP-binding protein [methanotrophic endosymbiont of Bathymodiolus puteoserpentis (Logatchev)]|jgi:ABC-type polysaccharide/polyol phosphate transport system ATPase subunit|uniref:ABC transporter ATP-binding protein n=1 Tax=methanotrophic endosymbiont of Bathymodiolus puteoserpentis (Logatchev) TaxID=343235 RepID=UPI0013CBCB92|nr:ABC transporter ATP-binding protein [methanotrophic endosymbiont of Bathymodiolus puteoserpentis (Logatchev)]SHE23213.1 Teichoic acid export ATP-binding protein TagH [methanotrophic endosymbiont of Bathymodiolus puteoserpentis (Logatchev)]